MKKVLAFCMMILMIFSMSISAVAAPGGFMSSPSGKPAPGIESFDPENEDCTGQLVITPYSGRGELSEFLQGLLEKAYTMIANSTDLTKLNADFAKLVARLNLNNSQLAVSDLFDIHVEGCDVHEGHLNFDVVLSADTLNKFVALLHMNHNGEWELVSDAKVTNNGTHLEFSTEELSPFAIVVRTDAGTPDTPQTGDNSLIHLYAVIMVISAILTAVIAVKLKKQKSIVQG